jgi:hypothetical protein
MELLYAAIAIGLIAIITYAAKLTLEKLNTKIEPFYAFDVFLPSSGKWSVIVFLIIVSILTLVVLATSADTLILKPA